MTHARTHIPKGRLHVELPSLQLPTTVVFNTPCILVSIDASGDITDVVVPGGVKPNGYPVVREHTLFANEDVAEELLLRKAVALTHPVGESVTDPHNDIYKVVGQTFDYQLTVVDKLGRERTFDPRSLRLQQPSAATAFGCIGA